VVEFPTPFGPLRLSCKAHAWERRLSTAPLSLTGSRRPSVASRSANPQLLTPERRGSYLNFSEPAIDDA
jgi:hypothetical protein